MARILSKLADEFESTLEDTEQQVIDGGNTLYNLIFNQSELIEAMEDGEDYDEFDVEQLTRRIEDLFVNTLDAARDAATDFDVNIDVLEDDVKEHFDAILRANDADTLADTVHLRYW